ncbi:FadR/GntR family transcriptional regulator [Phytoactinopolyspora mesophila]|uniref:FCD domain-containing protein n=1 Tax=Phytoactinopolyspora mesophila TaxID=2650750 RepID=A0A7K3M3C5_9ACTN|nr:FCD domain-containing protein [Phytoactinopolyspora mesophila]NDL57823.1 FCD domain-containing protein [Phytoactinopolyspora mesophila]
MLHADVLDTIGPQIVDGTWPEGHVLTLDWIQESFGVSRTVARETMRVLEWTGLVTSSRRVGITVLAQTSWNVFDPRVIWWRLSGQGRDQQLRSLTELRVAIEPVAASAAARHASTAERERAVALAMAMREQGDAGHLEEFLELDVEFHTLLLRASGNEMFNALGDVVAAVLRGRTQLGLMPQYPDPASTKLHEDVARSVAQGDGAAAESAMRDILAEVHAAMIEVWGS